MFIEDCFLIQQRWITMLAEAVFEVSCYTSVVFVVLFDYI